MNVTIALSDNVYSRLQTLAHLSGKESGDILQMYVESTINDFFERISSERYAEVVSPEEALAILRNHAGNTPPDNDDKI